MAIFAPAESLPSPATLLRASAKSVTHLNQHIPILYAWKLNFPPVNGFNLRNLVSWVNDIIVIRWSAFFLISVPNSQNLLKWVELVLVVSIARIFHPPLAMLISVVVVIVIVYLVQPFTLQTLLLTIWRSTSESAVPGGVRGNGRESEMEIRVLLSPSFYTVAAFLAFKTYSWLYWALLLCFW